MASAARAADAVHVVFRHVGQLVVHHVRQLVDVQTARRDVGSHQHGQAAVLEARQRPGAGPLALVAVDGHRFDAVLAQLLGQAVGAVLGLGEDQHLRPAARADQVRQQRPLAGLGHQVGALRHQLGGRVARGHVHLGRAVQQAVCQRADLGREGGREQQVLAFGRQLGDDAADIVDEAHVQHAVGFVQHEDLHAGQVDGALLHVVQQSARRGYQDVHGLAQRLDLRIDAHAPEDQHRADARVLGIGLDRLFHLRGEFTRGGEDQAAGAARLAGLHGVVQQPLQDGQREAGGLARAGLRSGQQVAAGQHHGNGLGLDGGGVGVAHVGQRPQQRVGQAKAGKGCISVQCQAPARQQAIPAPGTGAGTVGGAVLR